MLRVLMSNNSNRSPQTDRTVTIPIKQGKCLWNDMTGEHGHKQNGRLHRLMFPPDTRCIRSYSNADICHNSRCLCVRTSRISATCSSVSLVAILCLIHALGKVSCSRYRHLDRDGFEFDVRLLVIFYTIVCLHSFKRAGVLITLQRPLTLQMDHRWDLEEVQVEVEGTADDLQRLGVAVRTVVGGPSRTPSLGTAAASLHVLHTAVAEAVHLSVAEAVHLAVVEAVHLAVVEAVHLAVVEAVHLAVQVAAQ